MSFLSDVFKGDFKNLGNDVAGAFRPNELAQTLGGAAALALPFAAPAIGGLLGLSGEAAAGAGAGAGGFFDSIFGGGEAAAASSEALPFASEAVSGTGQAGAALGGIDSALGGAAAPNSGIDAILSGTSGLPTGGATGATTSLSTLGADPLTAAQDVSLGGAQGAQGASGGTSFLDKLVGGVKNAPTAALNQLTQNPLGVGAAGIGLGYNILQGKKTLPNQDALQSEANTLTPQAQQFMSYLQTGTLPAGLQAAVNQTTAARKAQIIANAARNGQSTDPTQNSSLGQDLAAADQQALIAVAQQGQALFQAGLSESQLSSSIMQGLLQVEQQQTANMGKAITNFASALGSGIRPTNTNNVQQQAA